MADISADDVDRIDKILTYVLENMDEFSEFEIDFTMSNADRFDRYMERTQWSERQIGVLVKMETKMQKIEEGNEDERTN